MNEKRRKKLLQSIYLMIDGLYNSGFIGGKLRDRFSLGLSDDNYVELYMDNYKILLQDCSSDCVRVKLEGSDIARYLPSIQSDDDDSFICVDIVNSLISTLLYEETDKIADKFIHEKL